MIDSKIIILALAMIVVNQMKVMELLNSISGTLPTRINLESIAYR
jgi:hypothetical protein